MPGSDWADHVKRLVKFVDVYQPYVRLLPRDNPELLGEKTLYREPVTCCSSFVGGSFDWLIGWVSDRLIGWSINLLSYWFVDWFIDCLVWFLWPVHFTERILDSYEREELQQLNDELQEKKRLLEERLTALNNRLKDLEELRNRLELERLQLAAYCDSMEVHVARLEDELRVIVAEADQLQETKAPSLPESDIEEEEDDDDDDGNDLMDDDSEDDDQNMPSIIQKHWFSSLKLPLFSAKQWFFMPCPVYLYTRSGLWFIFWGRNTLLSFFLVYFSSLPSVPCS